MIRGLVSTWYVPSYLPTPPEGALTLVLLCLPHAAASQENDNRAQRKDYTGKVLTNMAHGATLTPNKQTNKQTIMNQQTFVFVHTISPLIVASL